MKKLLLIGLLISVLDVKAALFARLIAEEAAPRARIIQKALGRGWACPHQFQQDKPLVQEMAYSFKWNEFYKASWHLEALYDSSVRIRLLRALDQDGDEEAMKGLKRYYQEKEFLWDDGASESYATTYGQGKTYTEDVQTYLHGLWPVVAVINPQYRAPLCHALTIGSLKDYTLEDHSLIECLKLMGHLEYPKNPQLAAFIQSLGSKDHLLTYMKDEIPHAQMASHQ